MQRNTAGALAGYINDNASAYVNPVCTGTYMTSGVWYHVAMTYNGTVVALYLNGTKCMNKSTTITLMDTWLTPTTFGGHEQVSNQFTGSIDEVAVFDRQLDYTEILALYGNGSTQPGEQYNGPIYGPTTNYTMRLYDLQNSSYINNFNVSLYNGSETINLTTTTGTISHPYVSVFNITVYSIGHMTKFYASMNTSVNLIFNTTNYWQGNISVRTLNKAVINFTIRIFNATVSYNYTTNNGTVSHTLGYTGFSVEYGQYGFYPYSVSLNETNNSYTLYVIDKLPIISHVINETGSKYYIPLTLNQTCTNTSGIYPDILNITPRWYNVDDKTSQINGTYNLVNSSYQNTIISQCEICTDFNCSKDNISISANQVDSRVIVRTYDYNGVLVQNPAVYIATLSTTYYSNSFYLDLSSLYNITNSTADVGVNVTDLNGILLNKFGFFKINETSQSIVTNMIPYQLYLNFTNDTDLLASSGTCADSVKQIAFVNTTFLLYQTELVAGRVYCSFGLVLGQNHTQFYEYYNNQSTPVTESVYILTLSDWLLTIKVTSTDGKNVEDAKVRLLTSRPSENTTTAHRLMGQRLTDSSGYTYFLTDSQSTLLLQITSDDYETKELIIYPGDQQFTKANPLIVQLKPKKFVIPRLLLINVPKSFSNLTKQITISGYVPANYENITYNTKTRMDQSLSAIPLDTTLEGLVRYFTIPLPYSNLTQYNANDEIVTLYDNNNQVYNFTLAYQHKTDINVNPPVTPIGQAVLYIVLIFVTSGLAMRFENSKTAIYSFAVGTLLMTLVNTWFYCILLAFGVQFGLDYLRRVIAE